jgi:hypothetical protein
MGHDSQLRLLVSRATTLDHNFPPSMCSEPHGGALPWLGTDQGRQLSSWLAENAEAPGARTYVDGLPVYFLVRADEYTKETFGAVAPEGGRSVNNISGCSP